MRCSPTPPSGRWSTWVATHSAVAAGGGGAGGMGDPFGGMGLGDIMDAFFGGGAGTRSRGPRSRVRQGDDALIPIELTLEECATGVAKDLAVDTATLCSVCHGNGCAEGTGPATCDMCKGSGEVQQIQRSLLGQVGDLPPVPGLPRLRRGHPRSLPAVQRRGSDPGQADGAGEHPGRCR